MVDYDYQYGRNAEMLKCWITKGTLYIYHG